MSHNHGELSHEHDGGERLHWHTPADLSVSDWQAATVSRPDAAQLDRIEASLTRLHERLDQAEALLHERATQFGPMMRMFAKAIGNGNGGS